MALYHNESYLRAGALIDCEECEAAVGMVEPLGGSLLCCSGVMENDPFVFLLYEEGKRPLVFGGKVCSADSLSQWVICEAREAWPPGSTMFEDLERFGFALLYLSSRLRLLRDWRPVDGQMGVSTTQVLDRLGEGEVLWNLLVQIVSHCSSGMGQVMSKAHALTLVWKLYDCTRVGGRFERFTVDVFKWNAVCTGALKQWADPCGPFV